MQFCFCVWAGEGLVRSGFLLISYVCWQQLQAQLHRRPFEVQVRKFCYIVYLVHSQQAAPTFYVQYLIAISGRNVFVLLKRTKIREIIGVI